MRQLTEYITAVGTASDESATITVAVRLVAAALGADVAAVVIDGSVRSCVGDLSDGDGLAAAAVDATTIELPGQGVLTAAVAGIGGACDGSLVVARDAGRPFTPEERYLVHGMAEALGLAVRGLDSATATQARRSEYELVANERTRLFDALTSRQRLLETLMGLQRSIAARRPLPEILDAATAGAADIIGRGTVVALLPAAGTGGLAVASSSRRTAGPCDRQVLGAAAEAMEASCVVARTSEGGGRRLRTILAAPVAERGMAVGALVSDSLTEPGRSADHSELLTAFAQQVSLALTDARTTAAIHDASHDPGTGLPNRHLFLDQLRQLLERGRPQAAEVTVLLVDLDRFNTVNDSLGYRGGDEVLAEVVSRIRRCVRADDLVGRLGGDEFGVLLSDASEAAGARVAWSIADAIREPFRVSGRSVSITACVGVATGSSSDVDPGDLLNNADVARSRAKQSGPGRIMIFEPQMHTEILERLSLLDDLQSALRRSEVRLMYQPLVHLGTGKPVGVEALARWRHPDRGNIPPATFIPLAEETGLIVELGLWILREGCRQVAHWRAAVPDIRLNVNVSARQTMDLDFVSDVAKALAEADLPAQLLTLELTETVLMGDPDLALQQLRQLKDLGVRLAIDDFGTGYSSLSYLRQFPVDQLKIDRSFVAGLETGEDQLAVTQTVMELGRTLRLETVAEGIEETSQLQTLRRIGCDLGQGFHLARPMEADAVRAFFSRPNDAW